MAQLDPARGVFAGILPRRTDLLMTAERYLSEDHFVSEAHKRLWRWMLRYWELSHDVITPDVMVGQAQGLDAASAVSVTELFNTCSNANVSDGEFRYYLDELRKHRADELTGAALTEAMELLTRGGEFDGKEVEPGNEFAWELLSREQARIVQLSQRESAPEGDVMSESSEFMLEYARRKADRKVGRLGIATGLPIVDDATGGFQPGDLVFIVGYVQAGKSQFCVHLAHHAAIAQAKNVFYVTTETSRSVTHRRLVARHSREERFQVPGGINSKALKEGTLSAADEATLTRVVHDLHTGVNERRYGIVDIAQVPTGTGLGYVEAALRRAQSRFPIDLVVIDYLSLLSRDATREAKAELIQQAKLLATTFDNGRGVPLVSPWQVTRAAYDRARMERQFDEAVTAETAEADRSADVMITMLRLKDSENKVTAQFLKNRDGEQPGKFELDIDYATSWFTEGASTNVSRLDLIAR